MGDESAARLVNVPRVGYRLAGPVARVAVGRRLVEPLELVAGRSVPANEHLQLIRPLGSHSRNDVWLVRHRLLLEEQVFKFARSGEQLAALKREFTAARLLRQELGDRPDIVPIRSHNFESAPFFLAYEYAGCNLREWSQEAHLDSASPDELVQLFLEIALAVAAAHSIGILHRDLKPSNILLSNRTDATRGAHVGHTALVTRWKVRLCDFGSSQFTSDSLQRLGITPLGLTISDATSSLLGSTPQYLAPELLAGEAPTTASDLYALGLILYQLLAGSLDRPMANGWERDIDDPLLIDDIRAATEGRPERRLSSVAQLIERLSGLDARRIQCAEASDAAHRAELASQRLATIRHRRPWVIASVACLVAAGLGATWFGFAALAAQRVSERAVIRAKAINDFLVADVLRSVNDDRLAAPSARTDLVDILGRASDRAGERFKDDAPVLGQVRRQLGDLYLDISFDDHAEDQYRRAIAVLEPLRGAEKQELRMSRYGLAEALTGRGRPRAAVEALETAERDTGAVLSPLPDVLIRRALSARIRVMIDAGQYRDALPAALRLVALAQTPDAGGMLHTGALSQARLWLCQLYAELGDGKELDRCFAAAAEPPLNDQQAPATVAARVCLRTGRDLLRQRHWQDAREAIEHCLNGELQRLRDGVLLSGSLQSELSTAYRELGRFSDSLESAQAALRSYASLLGERHSFVTRARIDLALSELELGRPADALRHLVEARARLDAVDRYRNDFVTVDIGRARALNLLGRSEEAGQILKSLDGAISGDADGRRDELEACIKAEQGIAMLHTGEARLGIEMLTQAVDVLGTYAPGSWRVASYRAVLAETPGVGIPPAAGSDRAAKTSHAPVAIREPHA